MKYIMWLANVICGRGVQMRTEHEIKRAYQLYSKTIYKVAMTYTQSSASAEDILQDTFIKYMESKKNFTDDEHIKAWLIRVAINEAKKLHRLVWNSRRVALTDEYSFSMPEYNEVFDAVMKLPENYRITIHLFYYEGYSVKEIGAILKKKENTVLTWLSRARNN